MDVFHSEILRKEWVLFGFYISCGKNNLCKTEIDAINVRTILKTPMYANYPDLYTGISFIMFHLFLLIFYYALQVMLSFCYTLQVMLFLFISCNNELGAHYICH